MLKNVKRQLLLEVIEGFFYLWRVTGNPLYRDWCWEAVQAIDKCVKSFSIVYKRRFQALSR